MPRRFTPSYFRRLLIAFLATLAVMLTALALLLPRLLAAWTGAPDFGPAPPPPVLLVPRGSLPEGPAGLTEWAIRRGAEPGTVGSGFLLRLPGGQVIGVTTAHSVGLAGAPGWSLEQVAFSLPGQNDFVAAARAFHGPPGQPRLGLDMTVDYLLLRLDGPADASLALEPDPRGAPEPGEEVVLSSGLDGSWLSGVTLQADSSGAWVRMRDDFSPYGLSGSPIFSTHTGQVVGMAIATVRRDAVYIGLHPAGNLLRLAQAAEDFPVIDGHQP